MAEKTFYPEIVSENYIDELKKINECVFNEIFKDAPQKNGIPIVSGEKIKNILNKYGFQNATIPEHSKNCL